ncbi:hypothetical protein FQN55_008724 [Onygenales sp. PD_40]|nr:hypothetical protein FQN55_008724 [Onygenales sp. PD_40]KAK2770000.1 hypothetical protein FQN53_005775 [Emmonsiellopsis sp. PD_33]KAK2807101.1 hypothetical protein FQN51_004715 [Onygenales sp. PD_10]
MENAARGMQALTASDYPAAITHYTRALTINPHATDYYIKRSTAYSRRRVADGGPNLAAALHDAEMGVALALQRARREQILSGQMRRAIVLYQLGRYGDARFLFEIVRGKVGSSAKNTMEGAMAANNTTNVGLDVKKMQQELDIWEMKVKAQLAKLGEGDEKGVVNVKEYPDIEVPGEEELKEIYKKQLEESVDSRAAVGVVSKGKGNEDSSAKAAPATGVAQPAAPQASTTPQPPVATKVRHEWYQTADTVVVTLYAKGVPKDKADIDIQEDSLSVSFPLATGSDYSFNLDPLFASIDPATSKATVMSTKIEIILRKQQPGQKWGGLEGSARPTTTTDKDTTTPDATITPSTIPAPKPAAGAPSYPTSSRTGAKDWDKVASSLTKKKKKDSAKGKENQPKDSAAGGEDEGMESDNSDYGSGDPVDSFFKKLYANADPDTRRAMVKSYYESEGTALSTNWTEVGKGKVEVKPPSDD